MKAFGISTIGGVLVMATSLFLASYAMSAESKPEAAKKSSLSAKELAFQKRMEKCIFEGEWCLVKDGQMTPWKKDKYTIQSATKVKGNDWVVTSRVQFGNVDVNLPIQVKVYWAGDTPVISVTDLPFPGGNIYTARVLVYRDTYAGSWFGKGYGGQMTGTIRSQTKEESQ